MHTEKPYKTEPGCTKSGLFYLQQINLYPADKICLLSNQN